MIDEEESSGYKQGNEFENKINNNSSNDLIRSCRMSIVGKIPHRLALRND